ncbi:hypothetical protein EDB84DRAFT_1447625 [Lactarius hengduanensis]|nr:hypothetical protein EDB84DRAFT_1447625 [Lactarius hengduanensis]
MHAAWCKPHGCKDGVTTARQWCNNGTTMVQQQHDNGATTARQWCNNSTTMAQQQHDNGATTARQWCNNGTTMAQQQHDNGATMARQWCERWRNHNMTTLSNDGVTMTTMKQLVTKRRQRGRRWDNGNGDRAGLVTVVWGMPTQTDIVYWMIFIQIDVHSGYSSTMVVGLGTVALQ